MLNTTTSFNTDQFLSKRVDPQKTATAACESLREAIALIVVTNTAINMKGDMTEDTLNQFRNEAKKFASSNHIVLLRVDGNKNVLQRQYDFSIVGNQIDNLAILQQMAKDLATAWREDSISFEFRDNHYHGFCWQSNVGNMIIGYLVAPESQPGDWDYDNEIAESKDDKTDDTAASTKDLERILNAGATWNAAVIAYKHGTVFNIDAINEITADVSDLKKTTKSWHIKDACQKLLASLSEYGFQ